MLNKRDLSIVGRLCDGKLCFWLTKEFVFMYISFAKNKFFVSLNFHRDTMKAGDFFVTFGYNSPMIMTRESQQKNLPLHANCFLEHLVKNAF